MSSGRRHEVWTLRAHWPEWCVAGSLLLVTAGCTGDVAEDPVADELPAPASVDTGHAVVESDRVIAEQGDAAAQARLAEAHYLGVGAPQDFDDALRWARLAAEQGHAVGQGVLAAAYNTGSGVAQDFTEALRWARLAAEQGSPFGQTVLASLHANGHGVVQDHEEAVRWARLAAEQGYADAQSFLGMSYMAGRGVERDLVSAYMWLTLSASAPGIGGVREAMDRFLIPQMTPEQIAEAEARVRAWRQ